VLLAVPYLVLKKARNKAKARAMYSGDPEQRWTIKSNLEKKPRKNVSLAYGLRKRHLRDICEEPQAHQHATGAK